MKAEDTILHAELEERLRSETLIADLSSKFVNLPVGDVDFEIVDAQRRICEFLGIDFSALWQRSDEAPASFTLSHFYSAQAGLQPAERMDEDQYPWARQQLMAGNIIKISSPEDLPAEAVPDRETLLKFGIKSNLALPLSVGGEPPVGLLGFGTIKEKRDWPDALVKRLQLVAQIFANALARKRTDQSLRESALRLNLAADSAEAGLWVLDCHSQVFWATEKARTIFGYNPGEIVSLARFEASVHPDDLQLVQRSLDRSVHAGEPLDVEYRIRLVDGRERWIASRGRPFFKSTGEPERLLGLSMDVTKRKHAEEAFRVSEARLAAGTELAGLGYYEVDYGGGNCFVDDRFREICGVPLGLQGLHSLEFWMEHVHPEDCQFLLDERQKLHDGRLNRISAEYRYLHPVHGEKWIHHLARIAERGPIGGEVRTYGVVRDITQQKRAEMETHELRGNLTHLARVNTLGALSGSLAHELNQPLGIILSNAQAAQELLLQEPPDVAEVQAILSDIVAADRRAGEVIQRLRALLKHGQISLQPISLNQVLEEVLHLTQADLIGRGVTVVCELAPDLPPIAGDRVQLQQLVLNLILNAAEAMSTNAPGKRQIYLQTALRHGLVRTSVRDEGGGLPVDVERLFQPFYTTKSQGLGMGLAICRSIMAAHTGRLWAEPHSERGAVFHFELPAAKEGTSGGNHNALPT